MWYSGVIYCIVWYVDIVLEEYTVFGMKVVHLKQWYLPVRLHIVSEDCSMDLQEGSYKSDRTEVYTITIKIA
jgi:hypothetical protein